MKRTKLLRRVSAAASGAALVAAYCWSTSSQPGVLAQTTITEPVVPLASLRTVPVPEPANLSDFVRDRAATVALGKALFWDMQVGSDGVQACGSCHFHAGADPRTKNQLSPAVARVNDSWGANPDTALLGGAPNRTLTAADFPFHKKQNPLDRLSPAVSDTNNRVGSQGVIKSAHVGPRPGNAVDNTTLVADPVFRVGSTNVRQTATRNAPSVINAIFNYRNMWDGSAQHEFNGVNGLGRRDPNARVVKVANFTMPGSGGDDDDDDDSSDNSTLSQVAVLLSNASLASQAVGPALNDREMSAAGRPFADVGRKFLRDDRNDDDDDDSSPLRPLGRQLVDPTDSVLGRFSRGSERGLTYSSYKPMIEAAFRPEWWSSRKVVRVDSASVVSFASSFSSSWKGRQYTVMQWNFSLFFGIAIQMYEATLVSNDTPFDRYMEGNQSALTSQQIAGLAIFNSNVGRCVNCHGGAEFTNAGVTSSRNKRLFRRSGNLLDNGFNNLGVRPTKEDLGVGANDPFGVPLSEARLAKQGRFTDPNLNPPFDPVMDGVLAVDGAFKTPGLRNVELTGPYFHNGGQATLRQVVDFYARGGDFSPTIGRDGEIFPLRILSLTDADRDAVVALLKGFTDDRVRFQRAPFDHPEIFVPNGALGSQSSVISDGNGRALDVPLRVPQVGRNGGAALKGFLEP